MLNTDVFLFDAWHTIPAGQNYGARMYVSSHSHPSLPRAIAAWGMLAAAQPAAQTSSFLLLLLPKECSLLLHAAAVNCDPYYSRSFCKSRHHDCCCCCFPNNARCISRPQRLPIVITAAAATCPFLDTVTLRLLPYITQRTTPPLITAAAWGEASWVARKPCPHPRKMERSPAQLGSHPEDEHRTQEIRIHPG